MPRGLLGTPGVPRGALGSLGVPRAPAWRRRRPWLREMLPLVAAGPGPRDVQEEEWQKALLLNSFCLLRETMYDSQTLSFGTGFSMTRRRGCPCLAPAAPHTGLGAHLTRSVQNKTKPPINPYPIQTTGLKVVSSRCVPLTLASLTSEINPYS